MDIEWKFTREGRAWSGDELMAKHELLPEPTRIEVHNGKLLFYDEERLTLLAMLIENVGLEKLAGLLEYVEDEFFSTWLETSLEHFLNKNPKYIPTINEIIKKLDS